jgi:hypothetical protein
VLFRSVWEPREIVEHLMEEWECMLNLIHSPLSRGGGGKRLSNIHKEDFSGWLVHGDSYAILVVVEPKDQACSDGDH